MSSTLLRYTVLYFYGLQFTTFHSCYVQCVEISFLDEQDSFCRMGYCLPVADYEIIYIYKYIYKWFGWKVKTRLDVASRQRCFVSCLTHQDFNTKCIYNNRHFKYPWNLHKGSLRTAQLLRCSDFFLCLQHETSSFLLFSVQRCGSRIIINFSSKHKLQRLLALLYGLARSIICHVITWLILLSFNDQTYLLSSVEFLDAVVEMQQLVLF